MGGQLRIKADKDYLGLDTYLIRQRPERILLVCGESVSKLKIGKYFETLESRLGIPVVPFHGFTPNPVYESVKQGVHCYREHGCSMIVAAGGGSAMDVAKCIRLFAPMNPNENYLRQKVQPSEIPLLVIPTTAGTGSEATHFAVIYFQGEKQSITHEMCLPDAFMLDPSLLDSLPLYQRKATCMDALCHALESCWSVNSTEESKEYAKEAVQLIMEYGNGYLENQGIANEKMLVAAHLAGKAINITQTTAGHALCYKLTSLYGIAHGHAAALCVREVWRYMLEHLEMCRDIRGRDYLEHIFAEIACIMRCEDAEGALSCFETMIYRMDLGIEKEHEEICWEELIGSVNVERLNNNPVTLTEKALDGIYHRIFNRYL
ncbi:MAG: phosphonoacetaldehyde reductase [Lachnospiraceae bacterium]